MKYKAPEVWIGIHHLGRCSKNKRYHMLSRCTSVLDQFCGKYIGFLTIDIYIYLYIYKFIYIYIYSILKWLLKASKLASVPLSHTEKGTSCIMASSSSTSLQCSSTCDDVKWHMSGNVAYILDFGVSRAHIEKKDTYKYIYSCILLYVHFPTSTIFTDWYFSDQM